MSSNHFSDRQFEDEHPVVLADDSSVQSSTRESDETTTNMSTFGEPKEDSSSDHISSEGKAAVHYSKLFVLVVLALATAAVGYATFYSTSQQEQLVFETQVSGVEWSGVEWSGVECLLSCPS
jgi:uncharacterized protein HemX